MNKLTSNEIMTAIRLAQAGKQNKDNYVGSLIEKGTLVEGLLLRTVLLEEGSKLIVKTNTQKAARCIARGDNYNSQVAAMLAKAMTEKNTAEMREIIEAINKFDHLIALVPGQLKYRIKYLVADFVGNESWKARAAAKLEEVVDANIMFVAKAKEYLGKIGRPKQNEMARLENIEAAIAEGKRMLPSERLN